MQIMVRPHVVPECCRDLAQEDAEFVRAVGGMLLAALNHEPMSFKSSLVLAQEAFSNIVEVPDRFWYEVADAVTLLVVGEPYYAMNAKNPPVTHLN